MLGSAVPPLSSRHARQVGFDSEMQLATACEAMSLLDYTELLMNLAEVVTKESFCDSSRLRDRVARVRGHPPLGPCWCSPPGPSRTRRPHSPLGR